MKYCLLIIGTAALFAACTFKQTTDGDDTPGKVKSSQGLATKKNGLECADIYWKAAHQETPENTFVFGEQVKISFDDVKGLELKNGKYNPVISIVVVDSKGDTVVSGIDTPEALRKKRVINLYASFTIATPFESNASYTALIGIKDNNGSGSIHTKFRFNTIPNRKIRTITEAARVNEVYVFDSRDRVPVLSGKIKKGHDIHLVFEGLDGFTETDGLSEVSVEITCKDPRGRVLLAIEDSLGGQPVNSGDLRMRVASPAFKMTEDRSGKILFTATVRDRLGRAKISSSVFLEQE